MLIKIIYEAALWAFAIFALPKMLYSYFFHRKYRCSLAKRFGVDFPSIHKGKKPLVWIHAVSMGETKAVALLAKKIKREKGALLLISSITETGHAEAKKSMPFADFHVYLPFDFIWIIKGIIKKSRPDLVILSETDFWYNFLRFSKGYGAKLALVNGKISEKSFKNFQRAQFFSKHLFSLFDLFAVQTSLYKERFEKIGIPASKIKVTGNMKLDQEVKRQLPDDVKRWKSDLGIKEQDKVIVFGSTHDPEEKMILKVLPFLFERIPNLKVMIVPRHPERFQEVAGLIKAEKLSFVLFSKKQNKAGDEQIVLIDAMGVLAFCYQAADLAVVCGSFIARVGGHNIAEPGFYGVPVFFGPCMHTQIELVELVKECGAGKQVKMEKLSESIIETLQNAKKMQDFQKGAMHLVSAGKGATARTMAALDVL